jgi:hypothetical protein
MATRPQYSREIIGLSTGQMSDDGMFRPCSCPEPHRQVAQQQQQPQQQSQQQPQPKKG